MLVVNVEDPPLRKISAIVSLLYNICISVIMCNSINNMLYVTYSMFEISNHKYKYTHCFRTIPSNQAWFPLFNNVSTRFLGRWWSPAFIGLMFGVTSICLKKKRDPIPICSYSRFFTVFSLSNFS